MKDLIIKRYEIKQKVLRLRNEANDLKKVEEFLDKYITYKALLKEDIADAERFKRLHLDSKREGLFHLRVKNGLKMDIPEIK